MCPSGHYPWLSITLLSLLHQPLYLAVCYFLPAGSRAYPVPPLPFPYDTLVDDCLAARLLGSVLLLGDFNARTGTLVPPPESASRPAFPPDDSRSRISTDPSINCFGRALISFYSIADSNILNGLVPGNSSLLSSYGCPTGSVVDYALASPSVLTLSSVLSVDSFVPESDYCPLRLSLTCSHLSSVSPSRPIPPSSCSHTFNWRRFCWRSCTLCQAASLLCLSFGT